MLQQNQQNREWPHPSLPQSLPAPAIRKTVPEHQSPLHQTAQQLFPPGCESPELKSPRPHLKPHANPYLLKHGPPPPPQPYHTKEKTVWNFFLQFKVCYTQVSGPIQTTCSNTLSSMRTRHFPHTAVCTQSHKRHKRCLHAHGLQIILYCSPASCLTHNVSLCTFTVFMWSIRIVCIFIFYLLFLVCIG